TTPPARLAVGERVESPASQPRAFADRPRYGRAERPHPRPGRTARRGRAVGGRRADLVRAHGPPDAQAERRPRPPARCAAGPGRGLVSLTGGLPGAPTPRWRTPLRRGARKGE